MKVNKVGCWRGGFLYTKVNKVLSQKKIKLSISVRYGN